ncbi:tumor necrosis factor ligand superfamily member 10-like isoform X1 [Latimeria chalumnae]|uniref:Tumor necrosis factor ligand superfamily member 10 n=1 Tax=Latimeria chalumnae TaxID=7897 RepID=H3B3N1_LATCH|nr:PREDICTED: tumor necrosis factor ligand superfamily member 10-like isoform X1 [Latimeria chalumnae]|eukprot:XP_005992946.1 PREDICTED: tumor necrosis factor ligand superfamily member 10-like isoform X1 [Latimeria chalumnae]
MAQQNSQDYFRSNSSDSSAYMVVPGGKREPKSNSLWIALALISLLILQTASTAGLFVYFTMSISKVKEQGVKEELTCLKLLNVLQEHSTLLPNLEEFIYREPCMKMANSIKSYISRVTEDIIRRRISKEARSSPSNYSEVRMIQDTVDRPSAHLTLMSLGNTHQTPYDLHQSCQYPINTWDKNNVWSHVQNLTYQEGKLKVSREGKYYLYSQIYFMYPNEEGDDSSTHQLVQCIYKKTAYSSPILLLKGVGTKCWAPEAEYGLHSVYQGGMFELKTEDELFVTVSSLSVVYEDLTSNYFGAFRLDI